MSQLTTLKLLTLTLLGAAQAKLTREPERGSETIEKILWAVAVIAIVGIVATAITNYVTTQAGLLG